MKAFSKISLLAFITLIVTGSDVPGGSKDKKTNPAQGGARQKTHAS